MKTIENVTLYKCDFCKKELKRKYAMVNHEMFCSNNPQNHKSCLSGCVFLETTKIDAHWIVGNPEYVENIKQVEVFKCSKLDKLMFPFSIERRKLHEKYSTYSDQEPMPKECNSFSNDMSSIFGF